MSFFNQGMSILWSIENLFLYIFKPIKPPSEKLFYFINEDDHLTTVDNAENLMKFNLKLPRATRRVSRSGNSNCGGSSSIRWRNVSNIARIEDSLISWVQTWELQQIVLVDSLTYYY